MRGIVNNCDCVIEIRDARVYILTFCLFSAYFFVYIIMESQMTFLPEKRLQQSKLNVETHA